MNIGKFLERLKQHVALISTLGGAFSIVSLAVGYISKLFAWGQKGLFLYLRQNAQHVWLFALTFFVLALLIWTFRLNRRFVSGFSEKFKRDLRQNWDFVGPWKITKDGTLIVTGSDDGGITKAGAQWENYTFSFKARIMNQCLGVIVRAQDLNNYYMFQIRTDKIRPHRRVAIPEIEKEEKKDDKESLSLTIKGFKVGWEKYESLRVPIKPALNGWFSAKITVHGESVSIHINDNLIFQRESFLKLPVGKVGFRNDGEESAQVKNVKVRLNR